MSEKEAMKIDALERKAEQLNKKVSEIYVAISGDEKLGLKGLVETLNDYVAQSKKNNETLMLEFKNFKRDLVLDYANDFKTMNDRIKPLEEAKNKQAQTLGIFGGIMLVFGYFLSNVKDFFKLFTD